jgi:hypothetical protein
VPVFASGQRFPDFLLHTVPADSQRLAVRIFRRPEIAPVILDVTQVRQIVGKASALLSMVPDRARSIWERRPKRDWIRTLSIHHHSALFTAAGPQMDLLSIATRPGNR